MTTAPDWPTCQHMPGSCHGIQTKGFDRCLAHLRGDELQQFLATLEPGSDLDARGTMINAGLLARLLAAVWAGKGPVAQFGSYAWFGTLNFKHAEFADVDQLGPLFVHSFNLDGARFARSIQIEVSANRMSCDGTRFDDGVTLRVNYAAIDASRVIFGSASSIAGFSLRLQAIEDLMHDWKQMRMEAGTQSGDVWW